MTDIHMGDFIEVRRVEFLWLDKLNKKCFTSEKNDWYGSGVGIDLIYEECLDFYFSIG